MIRIANGAGFWGDDPDAPRQLLTHAAVDFLTLEYLAELTMSILAEQRRRDPTRGFATDFLDVLHSIIPFLRSPAKPRIVTNAGGVNPRDCVLAAAQLLAKEQLPQEIVASVAGDDVTERIPQLQEHGCSLSNLETGQPLEELRRPVIAAHAYLGAEPIKEALDAGADLVITGRVADASLTVGPAVHCFGWSWDAWDRLAAATVAGHLIECGAQVTGGYSVRWSEVDLRNIGYPIAELEPSGEFVITKPPHTGGRIDRLSVIEQLTYEIDNPQAYRTPDVVADFTSVRVEEVGPDRVHVSGARGAARPDQLKVSLAYLDGYMASVQFVVAGSRCLQKAENCAELISWKLRHRGELPRRMHVEYWGTGEYCGRRFRCQEVHADEVMVRITVHDDRRELVEYFTRLVAPLITAGPGGVGGYAVGRSPVRPVLAYWPTLIPRELVRPDVCVRTVQDWLEYA